jgi:hypothetical protein
MTGPGPRGPGGGQIAAEEFGRNRLGRASVTAKLAAVPLSFNSRADAQNAIDDWVRRHQPRQTALDLAEFERDHHLRWFGEEYGRLLVQFEVAFDQLVAVVEQVNYIDRASWPQHRVLQYVLLSHNLKPFVSMVDRFSRRYYEDSVSHSRTLYETFLRAVFISCNRDDPWGAFPVSAPSGTPAFNATNFPRDELRLAWHRIYSTMSAVAHSNFPAIAQSLQRMRERSGDPEVFGFTFAEDERMLKYALTFLPFLLANYTRFIVDRCVGPAQRPSGTEDTIKCHVRVEALGHRAAPAFAWRATRRRTWKAKRRRRPGASRRHRLRALDAALGFSTRPLEGSGAPSDRLPRSGIERPGRSPASPSVAGTAA